MHRTITGKQTRVGISTRPGADGVELHRRAQKDGGTEDGSVAIGWRGPQGRNRAARGR